MKILKLVIFQPNAHFNQPFEQKYRASYILPPYSTVSSFLHSAINFNNTKEDFIFCPLEISIQAQHNGLLVDLQRMIQVKSEAKINTGVSKVESLIDLSLTIHVRGEDEVIDTIKQNIAISSSRIGRTEDVFTILEIKEVELSKNESYVDIKNDIYIADYEDFLEDLLNNGIPFEPLFLTGAYTVKKGIRDFKRIPVILLRRDSNYSFDPETIDIDSDGDIVSFAKLEL